MNYPSVKTLERAFPGKGETLRKLLTDNDAVNAHPAAIALVKRCYNRPTMSHMRMTALDAELETYGVEFVRGNGTRNTQSFEYCNTEETYATTIIRMQSGQYRVGNWGDIVERGNYE